MDEFISLINHVYPSTYPKKLEEKLRKNFTPEQLSQIDLFLGNWKEEIFEEMEEEHING